MVIGRLDVGARPHVLLRVDLHGDERREVAARVPQSDGRLPAEGPLPQQGQVHTLEGQKRDYTINMKIGHLGKERTV